MGAEPAAPGRDRRTPALLLTPYLVGLVVLVAGPALLTVALAFTDYDLIRPPTWVGTANFTDLAGDRIFWFSLRNSLVYLLLAVPLRLVAAVGLSLLLHRRLRRVGAYRASVYLPTVVPDAAFALVWIWLLNPLYGPLNALLRAVGIPGPAWQTDARAAMGAVVLMSLFQIGEGFLVALATRRLLPDELYEVAAMEGCGAWQSFRRVTLPLMAPTLLLLLFRDTVFSLQASFVPALLVTEGGPPPYGTTFLPLFVYTNGFEYLRYGYAAAATLVMFVVTAVMVAVQYRVIRRWRRALAV